MTRDVILKNIKEWLIPSGWYDLLRMFLIDDEAKEIVDKLLLFKEQKQRFVPALSSAFKWLQVCPSSKLKVILVCDIKENRLYNSGIPLDNKEKNVTKVNERLYKSIDKTQHYRDLSKWGEQGVLLLPMTLTWRHLGEAHYDVWRPFLSFLINKINHKYKDIPVMFIGRKSQSYSYMFETSHKFSVTLWSNGIGNVNVWKKINKVLVEQGKEPIKW